MSIEIQQLPESVQAKLASFPPQIKISLIAEFWQEKEETIRAQIRRGCFPVTVEQIQGGSQFIALPNLILYLLNGKIQKQGEIIKRATRNKFGRFGKRGHPSHAERKAAQQAQQNGGL